MCITNYDTAGRLLDSRFEEKSFWYVSGGEAIRRFDANTEPNLRTTFGNNETDLLIAWQHSYALEKFRETQDVVRTLRNLADCGETKSKLSSTWTMVIIYRERSNGLCMLTFTWDTRTLVAEVLCGNIYPTTTKPRIERKRDRRYLLITSCIPRENRY